MSINRLSSAGTRRSSRSSELSKRFLMNHWRAHAAGRDHETPMTDIRRPEWFGPWPSEGDSTPTEEEQAKDKVWEIFVHRTQWQLIPNVLATHWPGDSEVLSLIWEARDHHLSTVADADPAAYAVGLFEDDPVEHVPHVGQYARC